MPIIGFLPSSKRPTSIRIPLIVPSNFRPGLPCNPVTVAESVRTNFSGAFWISAHWTPISVMRIGNQAGHLNDAPVADPTPMNTPNPRLVTNVPSPKNANCRASPINVIDPTVSSAPIAAKLISSSSLAALVSRFRSTPVKTRFGPSVILNVSMRQINPSTAPLLNVSPRRIASVCGLPARSPGSGP